MRYPRANNYLTYQAADGGRCLITDYSGEKVARHEVDMETARFLHRLDGKTSPRKCMPDASSEEIRGLLRELKKKGLLRTWGKVLFCGLGSLRLTLWIPKAKAGRSPVPKWWNRILLVTWLPVLLMGILPLLECPSEYMKDLPYGGEQILLGAAAGLILGMLLHELSHGAAAMSYGVKVFEFGVFLEHFMPGAYTAVDERRARKRWHRIQIDGAGVEANLWLTGICLITCRLLPDLGLAFLMAAMTNLILGLANLCFWKGLDGMLLFSEILGIPDFFGEAVEILFDWRRKRQIKKELGISGYALLFVFRAVLLFQLLMPAAILINLFSLRM